MGNGPGNSSDGLVAVVSVAAEVAEVAADLLFAAGASAVHESDGVDGAGGSDGVEGTDGTGRTGVVLTADVTPSPPATVDRLLGRLTELGGVLRWVPVADLAVPAAAGPDGAVPDAPVVAKDRAIGTRLVVRATAGRDVVSPTAPPGSGNADPPDRADAPDTPHMPGPAGSSRVTVVVDGTAAFGGGSHPSTRLCLAEMEPLAPGADTVLDVGCGTGVLAIAAALLGARSVLAVDTDPAAVHATADHVALNGVSDRVEVRDGSVDALADLDAAASAARPTANRPTEHRPRAAPTDHPPAEGRWRADLVLANLLLPVIEDLGAGLVERVAPGGSLVVGGILEDQSERALAALAPLRCVSTRHEGDWVAMTLRHPADVVRDGSVNNHEGASPPSAGGRTVSGRG